VSQDNNGIKAKLFRWYQENQRVLPWRGSKDPYKIWLSEIIMQQTRVAQGTPYYLKFVEKYPLVTDLASADEQEVLKLWQGLGYYSRGRNLLKAAQQIVFEYKGVFPCEYNEVIKLKGIGPYTAAAIVSIAYNKPHAVLDGNVYRVLARLYAIEIPINAPQARLVFQKQADALLDKKNPGVFNEAMMELGATVCLPKNPDCPNCPVLSYCKAYKSGSQNILPRKLASRSVKTRYFHYLMIKKSGKFYIRQRLAGDIWQGLFELPLIETNEVDFLTINQINEILDTKITFLKPIQKTMHKLTHQHLEIVFYEADMATPIRDNGQILTDNKGLKQYPLPRPLELFLNDYLCKPDSIS